MIPTPQTGTIFSRKTDIMKQTIFLLVYSLLLGCSLCEDFTVLHKDVKFVVRSNTETNWTYYTNTFNAYYGWGEGTNDMSYGIKTFPERNVFYHIGTISSNTVVDIYYCGKMKDSTLLNSNVIGQIEIKYEIKPVAVTNYTK